MNSNLVKIAAVLLLSLTGFSTAHAEVEDRFTVHLTASATEEVDNDLLTATLSVERSGSDSAKLANEIAAIMRRALDEGKKMPAVKLQTSGYSTQPVYERRDNRNLRTGWRITQTLSLESTDTAAAISLIGRLQGFDLQLTGMAFTVSKERREALRVRLTESAIAEWRVRAEATVSRLGGKVWGPHEVSVQDEGSYPIRPMFRSDLMMTAEAAPPAVEAGTSQIRVTISGSAWGR